jgi:DNA invertase Pin-like site-specific DNA recombinase
MKAIKYNRVSTLTQSGLRFNEDTTPYDMTLLDKVSGRVPFAERPEASKLIKLILKGEVERVVVEEVSRLGRNAVDIYTTLQFFENHNIKLSIRDMSLESHVNGKPNPFFKFFVGVSGSFAEMEKSITAERTSQGRRVAKANGVVFGRPIGSNKSAASYLIKHKDIVKFLANTEASIRFIAKETEKSTSIVQRVKGILAAQGKI